MGSVEPERDAHAAAENQEPSTRARRMRILKAAASIALGVALLVGVLPRLADLSLVWDAVRTMTALELGALMLFSAWNILTYQFVMMSALPGLRLRHAFMTGQISTAVSNTVPAGALVGIGVTYAVLASFGHGSAAIARAAVLTGWWNTLVKLGLPVIALGLLAIQDENVNPGLLSGAAVGMATLVAAVVVLVLIVSSDPLARSIGRATGRFVTAVRRPFGGDAVTDWDEGFSTFRERSAGLLRHRWWLLTITTIVSHISLFWVLLAALRSLGVEPAAVTWQEALGAFAVVRLATALPITPGGIGLVEVGLSAALVIAGGSEPEVVAAVLVYRALTYVLQVILGLGSYVVWRADLKREQAAAQRSP
jgi:uncharacterized protein (TIRG00374 family)